MKVLVTGFGPFGNVVDNPTTRLTKVFDGERIAGRDVVGLALPTSFSRAPKLVAEKLASEKFDAMLMLGVAETAHAVRIERFARRRTTARAPDVDGALPEVLDGPEVLPVTADVDALERALESFGAEISDDAGAYVCNHTLYATLGSARGLRIGFLHLPPDERTLKTIPANAFRIETLAEIVAAAINVV